MARAIIMETGVTPWRVPHQERRWVYLRPRRTNAFPGQPPDQRG
jgi:hypothetical protein